MDYDSDDDGVYDGTELGVTTPIPERDEIKGTDIESPHFVIDSDPSTTTDPTEEDDDGDGLKDGLEDKNHNGAFDDGETDPLEVDTDGDGLYDGSALNQYDDPGEDLNDDGVVDDDESDPRKKDTDGDNLWDGDEVAPEYIDYDKYDNRYKSGSWYSSDPFDVDSDGDGLNDDKEIIGWPVRIFWEATLETVKGPYDVYSNPMVKDTEGEGLEDDQEFAYGSDPDEPDTDDDNVDDDVEVDRGDNPCGIEGRPPEITKLTVSAIPVVDDYQGTPYLKGWDVTVSISAEDSSGPYKFALKVLGGTPVEVELQEEDEDGYYQTEIDGSATVYVENDGGFDYYSAFITSTEDSVGNVLGTYIIADGLPQYSNNILTLINDGEDAVNHKRDVSGVEYESVPGDIINVEIGQWLAEKIYERLEATMEKIKSTMNWKNSMLLLNYLEGLKEELDKNNPESVIKYINNNDLSIQYENGGTRGENDGELDMIYFYLGLALKFIERFNDFYEAQDFVDMAKEIFIENDFDGDNLNDWEEYALSTDLSNSDSDDDGIIDGLELIGYPVNNRPWGYKKFYYKTNPMGTDKNNDGIADGWDTDDDGASDGDDPIPLDYDLDGDGYINAKHLVIYDFRYPRLSNCIKNDPNLHDYNVPNEPEYSGLFDNDMDGDGLPNLAIRESDSDPDDDNDGMSDLYEFEYGYPVKENGWQHRWIYNERYAIIWGQSDQFPAYWNDVEKMYDILIYNNFKDENIFVLYDSKNKGYKDIVDGPITKSFLLKVCFEKDLLERPVTKNDFLFYFQNTHGSYERGRILHEPTDKFHLAPYEGDISYEVLNNYLSNPISYGKYPKSNFCNIKRSVVVLVNCYSGRGLDYLALENRIVISACGKDGDVYFWEHSPSTRHDHLEFNWNDKNDGFVKEFYFDLDYVPSIYELYQSGESAAQDNDIWFWPDEANPKISNKELAKDTYI